MLEHEKPSDSAPETFVELTALLVAAVLGDADDEQLDRLNDLLAGDIELRRHASRFLEEEAALRHEFQVLRRVGEFHSAPVDLATAAGGAELLATCPNARGAWVRRGGQFLLAASLFAAMFVAAYINGRHAADMGNALPIEEAIVAHGEGGSPYQSAAILPPVTSVSWSGPTFARKSEAPVASPIREGVVDFTSVKGRAAQGYMVKLPPGALLDLVVAADAYGENALAVSEFDGDGRPTGRRISFSNSTTELTDSSDDPAKMSGFTKYGPLGIWTERNNSSRSRFYLFTSVHKLVGKSVDDMWHISRLSAMLEEADLIHIGWDDSGMLRSNDHEHVPDEDFDDLSATIRIRERRDITTEKFSGFQIISSGDAAASETAAVADTGGGFSFAVGPGEVVVVRVISRARAPVAVAVIEDKSGRTQWSRRHDSTRCGSLGVCALENCSTETRYFRLIGKHAVKVENAIDQWVASKHSILSRQETFATVGFEDGRGESEFNFVKVDLLTMSAL